MKQLREEISSGNLKNFYILYGEEDYLKDYYAKMIRKCVTKAEGEDFNVLRINEKFDLQSFEMFLSSPPVFNSKKVCIVKNTGIFVKINEADKTRIIAALENIVPEATVVFCEPSVDKRGSLYKFIAKQGGIYEFKYQKEIDLKNWVKRHLQNEKMTMSDEDISYFLSAADNGMYEILSEITKLVNYKRYEGVITKKDVDLLTCKSIENKVFEMINRLYAGDMKSVYKMLDDLKTLKTEPVMIVSLIFGEYSKIRKLKLFMESYPQSEALKCAGIRFYANEYIKKAKSIPLKTLDEIIMLCQKCDYQIKSGACEKYLALNMLIANAHNLKSCI
ncbi:MAG: DNA polymerase III subunit delta [Clostridia bacterium]|nr:DNA polymerase III subunit delta [Clostridia bacterium]